MLFVRVLPLCLPKRESCLTRRWALGTSRCFSGRWEGGPSAPLGERAAIKRSTRRCSVRAGSGPVQGRAAQDGLRRRGAGGGRAGGSGRRARLRRLPVSSSGAAAPGRAPAPRRAGPGGGRVAGPESGARQRWNGSAAGCIGFGICELRFL